MFLILNVILLIEIINIFNVFVNNESKITDLSNWGTYIEATKYLPTASTNSWFSLRDLWQLKRSHQ